MEEIRTDRLILRPFRESDYDDLCNIPSWKLLERAGLRREAHFRQNIFFHKDKNGMPIWKDTFVYAMLRDDYS